MNSNFDNNLKVIMYKDKKIITNLNVSFERNKIKYNKNIFNNNEQRNGAKYIEQR